jgi:predicted deacylase
MKILLLASQHGDEYSGEKLYGYIRDSHPELLPYVTYAIANPKARKFRTRFTGSDMNRSYTGGSNTYEERRAGKILKLIDESGFDLVLDMHTTTVDQPPCLILKAVAPENVRFLRATSTGKIVTMANPIVDSSINGTRLQAVSVEVYEQISDGLLEELCQDIKRYLADEPAATPKYVYEVTDLIAKAEISEADAEKLRNFEMSQYGYYPVLMGENAYKKQTDYLGFKAYKRYRFKV